MKKRTKKKGFTLIELIVVIAILGILAAVAVPRLAGFTGGAATKSIVADVKVIESAVVAYQSEHPTTAFTAIGVSDLGSFLDTDIITKYTSILPAGSFDASGKVSADFDVVVNGTTYTYDTSARTAAKKVV